MTIASRTTRCSYYLFLTLTLGRPDIAFPAETVNTPQGAASVPAEPAKATKPKPTPKAKPKEKTEVKADWSATPPGVQSQASPADSGKAAASGDKTTAPVTTAKDKAVAPATPTGVAAAPAADKTAAPTAAGAATGAVTTTPTGAPSPAPGVDEHAEICPPEPAPALDASRADTYKNMPFQPGEEARYILKYGLVKVHVGYGFLRVAPPNKYTMPVAKKDGNTVQEGRWHRVFSAEAYTGDWYKMIFAGHDKMQAFSRPWDFGVTKFYISQNEEKPFVRRFHAEKWLDFDHVNCLVHERTVDHKKKRESVEEHFLKPGAVDALGAVYKLRTYSWELNKTERIQVYTSEKNWWLEATPVAVETLETAVGSFKAYKLAVKTYLGKELQQRGKLFVWIAADHPNHPMLRVEGEVTFGSIYLELDQYKPGAA